MFNTVLIANRGEIACRIIRTAQRLGIKSIALYCHEDRLARHVAMADIAVEIDGPSPAAAYLDAAGLISIAQKYGADCIHPGYGFLSENADFAEACQQAGIAFIGPDAAAIRLMGDKVRSREFAIACGVPVSRAVSHDGDMHNFVAEAGKLGFPLLIKASAGGGGKGMSIVRDAGELAARAGIAASEAQRYFGSGRIYAERYIERPRHIEVQVFGDGEGNAIHLGERECSIQRRFQKIVEEAPAANLEEGLRQRICAAAVDLVKAARYRNAGTVEFILSPGGDFFFLEMNTRLQVEHPVTEMIYGLDLVELQFRIAAGQGIGIRQQDLRPTGHAIEVRICAEDPENDFAPAIGLIGLLAEPPSELARFDSGLSQGQAITPAFDSMLAKLIVHDNTRAATIDKLLQALQQTAILGLDTNLDYLARIVDHAAFRQGDLHTGFLAGHSGALLRDAWPTDLERAAAIAAVLGDNGFRLAAFGISDFHASLGHWRN